ncbi:MAG: S1 RNA-binding domain-containing protein [Clostridia bacterium]|nr:S1 RNA-binding domain-containing protein [Clostridia bacterium]
MQIEEGNILQGKISGIAPFGALVELEGGKTGLVHISEVSATFVEDINQHLAVGQAVKVKVVSVDEKGKIGLSIKRALDDAPKKNKKREPRPRTSGEIKGAPEVFEFSGKRNSAELSFEDKLLKFKQDSDEKIQDLKRNTESKRNGGYKRNY